MSVKVKTYKCPCTRHDKSIHVTTLPHGWYQSRGPRLWSSGRAFAFHVGVSGVMSRLSHTKDLKNGTFAVVRDAPHNAME